MSADREWLRRRRTDLSRTGLLAMLLLLGFPPSACAQDADWVRAWEEANRQRPRTVPATGRIAGPEEPGPPLVIHGRVMQSDGVTPAAGIVVFAYQTDRTGVYNHAGAAGWRLHGWARSDAQGRFVFHTIRPGSYPGSRNPAHVHLTMEGPDLPRRWTTELRFADDPYLTDRMKRESEAAGAFGGIRPVVTRQGVQHVDLTLRISGEGRF